MKLAHLAAPIVFASSLALSPVSQATTIRLEKEASSWFGLNGSASAKIIEDTLKPGPGGLHTLAGGFALKGDLNGDTLKESFTAWCVDITRYIAMPTYYKVVNTSSSISSVLTAARLANIKRLYETAFSNLILSDNNQSAGFQLALWELTYENNLSFDLGTGNFKASNSSAITFGQQLLTGLFTKPILQNYNITVLESVDHVSQHLVTASPVPRSVPPAVPLPSAGILLLSGIAALGLLRRRQRR